MKVHESVMDVTLDETRSVEDRNAARPQFDPEKWDALLKALAEGAEKIPLLPPEALTREAIYRDHD